MEVCERTNIRTANDPATASNDAKRITPALILAAMCFETRRIRLRNRLNDI